MEAMLNILRFAMQSSKAIVDPLSHTNPDTVSTKEKTSGNQIAIHFLATCKALHTEGTRYLWELNDFVFTSPEALHQFGELNLKYRQKIKHVTLRIVARYYEDQRRPLKFDKDYHASLKSDPWLKIALRPKESILVRGGFRCYTWNQVVDFLTALRAPYDPSFRVKNKPRPKLLPSLSSMRIDLVNFIDELTPFPGLDLHNVTSHELACSLDELQVTGMPFEEAGLKASTEFSGLLKDDGLYLDGPAAFVALKDGLHTLSGSRWSPRVIRSVKRGEEAAFYDSDDPIDDDEFDDHQHPGSWTRQQLGLLPPAPPQEGHPKSSRDDRLVIWKKVPTSRDGRDREWIEFSRYNGYEVHADTSDSDNDEVCPSCGDLHHLGDDLDLLSDDDDDDELMEM